MGYAQIAIDQFSERRLLLFGGRLRDAGLPSALSKGHRLRHQVLTRREVLVKATNREAGFLHEIGDTDAVEPGLTQSLRRDLDDAVVGFRLSGLRASHPALLSIT